MNFRFCNAICNETSLCQCDAYKHVESIHKSHTNMLESSGLFKGAKVNLKSKFIKCDAYKHVKSIHKSHITNIWLREQASILSIITCIVINIPIC